ncbi:hypothetical protein OH492_14455 [Vibrio chagasii]|nr:hypothetical protein [Vibrio chagasii]
MPLGWRREIIACVETLSPRLQRHRAAFISASARAFLKPVHFYFLISLRLQFRRRRQSQEQILAPTKKPRQNHHCTPATWEAARA